MTYKAAVLLVKETWGSAVVSGGTKQEHLAAVAHGKAAGVKIKSADEKKFTSEDWNKIRELAAQLKPLYEKGTAERPNARADKHFSDGPPLI